jgi:hypothetical protein
MEAEDDKAITDGRSVFIGNLNDTCPYFAPRLTLPARYRSIIVRQLKISRPTSKHAVRSTVSQSSLTNLQVTPKGKQLGHFASFSRNKLNSFHNRFAYVKFAEPEFMLPWHWIFYGRLIKVCVAVRV